MTVDSVQSLLQNESSLFSIIAIFHIVGLSILGDHDQSFRLIDGIAVFTGFGDLAPDDLRCGFYPAIERNR
jgi:hypothetical protein